MFNRILRIFGSRIRMKQKLTHWVNEEHKEITLKGRGKFRSRDRRLREKFEIKPVGFWLSVNNSWENWLGGNWDSWLKGKVCLQAELAEDINLFVIKTKKQFLDKFYELTGKVPRGFLMDWHEFHQKMREHYDGMMLLAEPFWKHRMDGDFMYFYGWDCESICVWNKKKIKFREVNK